MGLYKEASGYIIHQRNYRNSSLIIEFLSHEEGMLHLIAKGIKENKKLKTQLQYFSKVKVIFFGKSDLKTLSSLEVIENNIFSDLINKTSGLYLNELIHYCLLNGDSAKSIYDSYVYTLENLPKKKLSFLLRNFEKKLLKYLGFELNVESFKCKESWLTIINNSIEETIVPSMQLCKVSDLDKFIKEEKMENLEKKRLNNFMLKMIDMCVSHRRIFSREMLISLTTPSK